MRSDFERAGGYHCLYKLLDKAGFWWRQSSCSNEMRTMLSTKKQRQASAYKPVTGFTSLESLAAALIKKETKVPPERRWWISSHVQHTKRLLSLSKGHWWHTARSSSTSTQLWGFLKMNPTREWWTSSDMLIYHCNASGSNNKSRLLR